MTCSWQWESLAHTKNVSTCCCVSRPFCAAPRFSALFSLWPSPTTGKFLSFFIIAFLLFLCVKNSDSGLCLFGRLGLFFFLGGGWGGRGGGCSLTSRKCQLTSFTENRACLSGWGMINNYIPISLSYTLNHNNFKVMKFSFKLEIRSEVAYMWFSLVLVINCPGNQSLCPM